MKRLAFMIVAAIALAGFAKTASAQYRPPGGSPLPIELDYLRPQQGVLDNYNQFVAPKYQLANQLKTLDQNQRNSFRELENQIQKSDRVRGSRAAATGTSAGFMNYSHYYSSGGGGGGRRR
jgi:hypothetical protein